MHACALFFLPAVIPIISNITEPMDTLLGQPAAFLCLVTGSPPPTVTWQQDGVGIINGSSASFFNFRSSGYRGDFYMEAVTVLGELGVVGVLSIDSVVRGETGNYICTATNELPETRVISTTSSAVPLLVLGKQKAYSYNIPSHTLCSGL